jgi:hypothetical protein
MILLLGKTWFLSLMFLNIFLVRWFHLVSSKATAMGFEVKDSVDEKTPATSGPISTTSGSHLLV